MDLDFSAEDLAFRDQVRTWLAEHVPAEPRPTEGPEMRAFDLAWQRAQFDGGYAGVAWPAEYGGCGLSLVRQMSWYEEYALAGGPPSGVCFVGLNHAGPTLINRGTDEQNRVHLPRILRGEAVWCQGFSEPDAGSDLAGLSTRAVVDGDELVVTGQKIWTSYADLADYQELLVRTDPDAAKHKGITWVVCDMHTPGIDIRPIRAMSGEAHFCEVFYDEVRIPLANVVGGLNNGWSTAMATLSFERGTAFMAEQIELARKVEELIDLARQITGPDGRRRAIEHDDIALQLAERRAELASLRAMTYAAVSRNAASETPGPEGSIIRLHHGEVTQRVYATAMDILGPRNLHRSAEPGETDWTGAYLYYHAATIAGGTSEIQRNIIGERVLGLPR